MKWWFWGLTALALVGIAGPSRADSLSQAGVVKLSIVEGGGLPVGSFGDIVDWSFNLGASAAYQVTNRIGLGMSTTYRLLNEDDDARGALTDSAPAGTALLQDLSQLGLAGTVRYSLRDNATFSPYIEGFAGVTTQTVSVETRQAGEGTSSEESSSESDLSYGGGVGLEMSGAKGFGGFVGVSFISIASEDGASNLLELQFGATLLIN